MNSPIRFLTFTLCLFCASFALAGNPPGHWSFPGDIQTHLRQGHGQTVASMSYEQMLTLHDSLHRSGRNSYSSPVRKRTVFRIFRR